MAAAIPICMRRLHQRLWDYRRIIRKRFSTINRGSRLSWSHLPGVQVSSNLVLLRKQNKSCLQCCKSHSTSAVLFQKIHYSQHSPYIQDSEKIQEKYVDPYKIVAMDLNNLFSDIKNELNTSQSNLKQIADYYFDGQGKAFRPVVVILMARTMNNHVQKRPCGFLPSQRQIAMISEMIHTASLIHDDVIDTSQARRGKPSVNTVWGHQKAVLTGDYILSIAGGMLARIQNEEIIIIMSQIFADLVQGEFMQLGSKETENERFSHYLLKTYKKTASLLAHSCKAVSVLSGADSTAQEIAFQYGKNIGIAFQLIDDLLDFASSQSILGKPAAADLELGLATAPVLFASAKFPELNDMIMRRFSKPGDVEKAFKAVLQSDGIEQTQLLAQTHCKEAIRQLSNLIECQEHRALINMCDLILNRMK